MIADLPLVDQVWMFSAVLAIIAGSLAILVLLGPEFVRDIVRALREMFTEPRRRPWCSRCRLDALVADDMRRRHEQHLRLLARDAEIQELQ